MFQGKRKKEIEELKKEIEKLKEALKSHRHELVNGEVFTRYV